MKHVKPAFEQQLNELARTLVTPQRYGKVAMAGIVEFPHRVDDPPNVYPLDFGE